MDNAKDKNNTRNTLSNWHNFRLKIIFESIVVGACSALIVVFYRYALEKALSFSKYLYRFQIAHLWFIPIWLIILVMAALLVGLLVYRNPMISGSGIPQVEGVLLRKLDMNWWKVIVGKFVGGVICIGAGLSLGREGPSIQIGAAAGEGISRIFKRAKMEEKFLITSGASAGLSAAFNAPFAGVIFALEEVHKNFSPIVMTSALAASITADFISKHFFGLKPMFNFQHITPIPLDKYGYILILGIIVGILGVIFNKTLLGTQALYKKQAWLSPIARPIIPFLMAGVLGLVLPQVLGGGHELISLISETPLSIKLLLIVLVVKFFFTMISFGSSAPGGIFLPMLVIGALIGVLYGDLIHSFFGFDKQFIVNLMILAMAGYFSSIVKAPITGCILITEMTGSFSHLLSISTVCLTAYVIAEIAHSKPIYESLLERLLSNGSKEFQGESKVKVIIETAVCLGSCLEGKAIKEVAWPSKCLLVGIKRGDVEIIPKGDTLINAGDYLIALTDERHASAIREKLSEAAEKCTLE